jgi:putative redox protein
MYARRKGWDLAEVSIDLTHDRVHATDSQHEGGRIELVQREISIRGQLSEEQRERLLEIAARSPVHKTLLNGPKIVDSIVVSE